MKPGCWNIVPIKVKYSGTFSRRIKDAFVLSSWPNSFTKLSWNTTKMNPRHGRNGRNSEPGTNTTKKRRRRNKEKEPNKKHRRHRRLRRRRCYDYERKRYFVRDVTLGRDGLSKQDSERIQIVLPAAAGTTNTFSHRDKNDFVPSKWHKSFTNTSSIATETKQGPGRSSKTPNANQR